MGVEIQENVVREAVNYASLQTDWAAASGMFSQPADRQFDCLSFSLPNLTIQGDGKNLTVALQKAAPGTATAGGASDKPADKPQARQPGEPPPAAPKPPEPGERTNPTQGPQPGDRGDSNPKGESACGYSNVEEMRRERDLRTKNFVAEQAPPGTPPRWGFSPSFFNQPGFAGNPEANGYPPTNFENKSVQTDQGYSMLVSQKVNADGQVQTRTSEFPNCPYGVSMIYDRQNADGTATRERYDNVKRINCERQADGSYTTTLTMIKDGKETTATIRTTEDGRWIDDKTGQGVDDRHSPGYLRHRQGEAQMAAEEALKRPLLSPAERQAYEKRKVQLQQAKANPASFLQQTALELQQLRQQQQQR